MPHSAWKYLPFLVILSINKVDARPGLYPDQPAVQIPVTKAVTSIDQGLTPKAESILTSEKTVTHTKHLNNNTAPLRIGSTTDQFQAQAALRGGIYFLLEVDMNKAIAQRMATVVTDLDRQLRENKLKFNKLSYSNDAITLQFANQQDRSVAASFLATNTAKQFNQQALVTENRPILKLTYSDTKIQEIQSGILSQNLMSLRNRIKALGISESTVRPQANNHIEVELLGVQDPMLIKYILARPLTLEFRMVSDLNDQIIDRSTGQAIGTLAVGTEVFALDSLDSGKQILLDHTRLLTNEHIQSISTNHDQLSGLALVSVNLDSTGTKLMADVTRSAIGKRMAILLIENKLRITSIADPKTSEMIATYIPYTESVVISAAKINEVLGSSFSINSISIEESNKLALMLGSSILAAPMYLIEERVFEPKVRQ